MVTGFAIGTTSEGARTEATSQSYESLFGTARLLSRRLLDGTIPGQVPKHKRSEPIGLNAPSKLTPAKTAQPREHASWLRCVDSCNFP